MKLSYRPTKFKNTLVKPYYEPVIGNIDINTDVDKNIPSGLSNLLNLPNTSDQNPGKNIPTNDASATGDQNILSIPAPIKRDHSRSRKYPIQVNLVIPALEIGFVLDTVDRNNVDFFVTNDINLKLSQFTASKQKKNSGFT